MTVYRDPGRVPWIVTIPLCVLYAFLGIVYWCLTPSWDMPSDLRVVAGVAVDIAMLFLIIGTVAWSVE